MAEGDTLANAVVGALAAAIAGAVVGPIGPLIGGAVAGYLDGGARSDGVRVGALAGLLSLIPGTLFGALVLTALGVIGFGFVVDPSAFLAVGAFGVVFVAFALVIATLTTAALGALGGWVGNYLKYDADL
ncbi:DUF5518 domain-containing protein [Halomicrobium urmianum]|uniref:DUF5518 domain-containing protein n=1 Tax=Halomicrobium urmianum TaxID=1586233 RepID=UPI001CD93458|nr:DUF5518 domain-containing protein [Halomicrobium urmianum]